MTGMSWSMAVPGVLLFILAIIVFVMLMSHKDE
jgi:hypothetical protein